jgi:hypothetical protein
MSILIADLESSRKIESDEYDIIDSEDILFLVLAIFRHMTHDDVLLVILDVFDSFLFFRVGPLF